MKEATSDLGLQTDGSFRFHIPFELKKSRDDGKVYIEGIASMQTPDIANETVIQNGMDLSYFLSRGFFNDNHAKDSGGKVGVPLLAEHTPQGLRVKGYLLDTPRAQGIIELATALAKSGGDRQLGFSVEGKVSQRDGRIIQKSWIKDIAITAEPVHPDTYMNICKSISTQINDCGITPVNETPVLTKSHSALNTVIDTISETTLENLKALRKILPDLAETTNFEKALEAGHQNPATGSGGALRREALETDLKNQDIPQKEDDDEEDVTPTPDKKPRLSKSQALEIVKSRGHSATTAQRMVDLLFNPDFTEFLNKTQKTNQEV
ncbi:MAG: hypothetical protein JEZ11_24630 [Desulfobacterales bacterium]|nr:hypothetical protein [Desulfobacterales bacterium]